MRHIEGLVNELGDDATAERLVAAVAREADSMPDDVAVALIRVDGGSPKASTLRVEEVEVTLNELSGLRLRRFLAACGISDEQIEGAASAARPLLNRYGSIVLRVRLVEGRSAVDILPVQNTSAGGELAALRKIS